MNACQDREVIDDVPTLEKADAALLSLQERLKPTLTALDNASSGMASAPLVRPMLLLGACVGGFIALLQLLAGAPIPESSLWIMGTAAVFFMFDKVVDARITSAESALLTEIRSIERDVRGGYLPRFAGLTTDRELLVALERISRCEPYTAQDYVMAVGRLAKDVSFRLTDLRIRAMKESARERGLPDRLAVSATAG